METIVTIIGIALVIGLFYVIVRGGIQTFRRNWILALLLILFIGPVWILWAIVENFMDKPVKQPIDVNIV